MESNENTGTKQYQSAGRCHCGDLHYDFKGSVITSYACHCSDCQIVSGSAFTLNLITLASTLTMRSGLLASQTYSHQNRQLVAHSCPRCQTTLWVNFADSPYYSVQTGTLLDRDQFAPVAHIWMHSALSWIKLAGSAKQFDREPANEILNELWKQHEGQNAQQSD